AVATVLEQQFSTIAGIDSMVSSSSTGGTQITLQFTLDRNIDAAAQDVQAAIAAVQRRLPTDMPAPPSLRKTNPADQPVIFMALYSPTLPLSVVDEYAETMMSQRISTVDGVLQVLASGQLANAAEFTNIVVAYRNGAPVRLGELAQVIDSVQESRVATWYAERGANGKLDPARSIVLAVQKQPGVNT